MTGRAHAILRSGAPAGSDKGLSLLELFGTVTLLCNVGLLLFAGILPPGAVGFTVRWGTAALSLLLIVSCLGHVWRPLLVFAPYILSGLVATPLGYDPVVSATRLAQMNLSLGVGLVVGYLFDSRTVISLFQRVILLAMALSCAFSVLVPAIGVELYGTTPVWKGTFAGKNYLGWASALGLILSMTLSRNKYGWENIALGVLSFVCLVKSQSIGSLSAALLAIGYYRASIVVGYDRTSPIVYAACIVVCASTAALLYYLYADMLFAFFGRDASFTGRDQIWKAYLREIGNVWLFGLGPGSFTSDNGITAALRANNDFNGQMIRQPHSSYIGLMGDSGLFGLASYILVMLAFILWYPSRVRSHLALGAGAVALAHLAVGVTETRDIFSEGLGMLLLALLWGGCVRKMDAEGDSPSAIATRSGEARVRA